MSRTHGAHGCDRLDARHQPALTRRCRQRGAVVGLGALVRDRVVEERVVLGRVQVEREGARLDRLALGGDPIAQVALDPLMHGTRTLRGG